MGSNSRHQTLQLGTDMASKGDRLRADKIVSIEPGPETHNIRCRHQSRLLFKGDGVDLTTNQVARHGATGPSLGYQSANPMAGGMTRRHARHFARVAMKREVFGRRHT